ncbi:glycosyltransferase [Aquabacterium sp.]|uniref:glycosyltransferase n=1 Tax=Aquabacterium TaxID=92793 RepID=UPI001D78D044|nr:glycosyltransferase [Aquabacterium sp.]MBT9608619.1 glycosyltransferase [Aquabacterium sp.]|tara:strand:- start:175 stop:1314 length:1140 start_codon:yes stop_codon:yes gene_type:complete
MSPPHPEVGTRILFFADASSVHTRRWVAAVVERGAQAIVITRQPAEVPGATEVIAIAPGSDKLTWFKALPEVRRVAREVAQRFQPTLVHGHYVTSYGLWAAVCGLKLPTVLTAWGSDILVTPRDSRLMRLVVAWSLRHADLITADSMDMIDEIARYHPQAPCHQILWGADTDVFMPMDAASAPGHFDIVSLRSWEPNYNIDTIVAGFARFVAQRPQAQARLHLLGGGSLSEALHAQVAELGLQDQVQFHGRVNDVQMVQAIQQSRVSVSVPTSDATSVSVLESMACGLPVLASDLPANRQWVDEQGGWVVPVRDAEALSQALLLAHDHPVQSAQMGLHNRERIERDASRRGQMDAMWRLYQRLLHPTVPRQQRKRAVTG